MFSGLDSSVAGEIEARSQSWPSRRQQLRNYRMEDRPAADSRGGPIISRC
jgi:hypothetical protein